jgi:hypothetical protein
MKIDTTKALADVADEKLFDNWFDPIETDLRTKVRGFIDTMIEDELETALSRPRYGRRPGPAVADDAAAVVGHRHGHRTRSLTGTFGPTPIAVPRARIIGEGRQDHRVEEQGAASLSASHARRRRPVRLDLSRLVSRFRSSYAHFACVSSVWRQKRSMDARMASADFVQWNGLGAAFLILI